MLAWDDYKKAKERRGMYKDTSKEERAYHLGNVICPKCGYQNHIKYVRIYGTCNLCKTTLDKRYFIKKLMRMCKNG